MTESTSTATRPPGTSALIYAVVSAAAAVVLWLAFAALSMSGFFALVLLGMITAVASAAVALVIGVVKRLAGGNPRKVNLRRVVLFAAGVPAVLFAVGLVFDLLAGVLP